MRIQPYRIYADTSVIGGCFDPEFSEDSLRLIDAVRKGRLILLISHIVLDELELAPEAVRSVLPSLPLDHVENIQVTEETIRLRDAYLAAKILPPRFADDAGHVAAATVARADAIVSWNFQHIVRLDKMRAYNAVNLTHGYGIISLVSPREVTTDE